jgi:uncharacterized damage-inducible protein DinB
MKKLFEQYSAYNVWANHRIIFTLEQLEENQWYHQVPSSFDSLYKTVLHVWDAESIWLQRMRLHEQLVIPSKSFDPSFKDACNGWMHQSMQWEAFIKSDQFTDEVLDSKLIYKNLKGEEFYQPVSEVIQHVFNHSTYHRGQLITMLHALKVEKLPATDFILYTRTQ